MFEISVVRSPFLEMMIHKKTKNSVGAQLVAPFKSMKDCRRKNRNEEFFTTDT